MRRIIYIILASFFVTLGSIGIFLPLIPTTPFLLLAVYFYMNSSYSRLKWLLNNKYLGPYIHSYLSKEGIPVRLKIKTISLLWITISLTFFFATDNTHIRIFLGVVAIGVTIHLLLKKTKY
ncbi:MAG: YbaN family protein [Bacteroidales bacterium]|nr:YbaN family protein [Bacteroidales bacterium]MDD3273839.1 YbaN family protein [Bacteroidales bacterium]MDD4058085.1 YbaN family protein [Bacteroidales bacterium]